MGAMLTKLNCCKNCRKSNKVHPTRRSTNFVLGEPSRQEDRTSIDIIKDLTDTGFITRKTGGVKFSVDLFNTGHESKTPRRLPALVCPEKQKLKKTDTTLKQGNNIQYDREEKDLMTEIRRNGALAEKGNTARKSEERRKEVIARRDAIIKRKIRKTEEKLRKDAERTEQMKKGNQNAKIVKNSEEATAVAGDNPPIVSM
ncbi:Hypothetical predicted protein [Mytilus galloprovincialis]|uniref:Uncharacterized protein n=1 Tax=Mytilus galloprovincialis TaxID=29158 RepID=A0A8B6E1F5_MYTGA|nr:Hypothetical predicted protein [Mytilus galloprovincialis]